MDFTDADVPPANMKDWHICLKAKQISLLFLKQPPLQLTLLLLLSCLFSTRTQACLKDQPAYFTFMCMFVFMCIYFINVIGHCVMFVYREGFCGLSLTAMSCTQLYFCCFPLLLFNLCVPLSLLLYISFSPDSFFVRQFILDPESSISPSAVSAECCFPQLSLLTQRTKFTACSHFINPLKPT